MIITSAGNEHVKRIKQLKDRKYRKLYGQYIVEGIKSVKECIQSGKKIVSLYVTEKLQSEFPKAIVFSDDLLRRVSSEETPQGVLAVVQCENHELHPPEGRCILLDGLQDCGNMGTIIRTANACGYKEIYCINCADPYAPKTVRASMSGIFFTDIMQGSYEDVLCQMQGIPLICADMEGIDMYNVFPPPKFCLCIGSEGKGISDNILKSAEYKVSIPMDKSCESLNAAVSAGILMYHLKYNVR